MSKIELRCVQCGARFMRYGCRGQLFCSHECYASNRTSAPAVRFADKWEADGDCWRWISATLRSGHGAFRVAGRSVLAHRFSFEQARGRRVRRGRELHHACGNPWCVNPEHLEELTRREHMKKDGRIRPETSKLGDPAP